jgi:hypothetical protein
VDRMAREKGEREREGERRREKEVREREGEK